MRLRGSMAHTNILRIKAVKARTALSRSSIYKLISDGNFPRAIRLGPRAVGWLEGEIEQWLSARVMASRELDSLRPTSCSDSTGLK